MGKRYTCATLIQTNVGFGINFLPYWHELGTKHGTTKIATTLFSIYLFIYCLCR